MNRREFLKGLGGVLAAGMAPAFIGSEVLMPVKKIWTPPILWGDGIHDDSGALQAYIDGGRVIRADGAEFVGRISSATLRLGTTVVFSGRPVEMRDLRVSGTANPFLCFPAVRPLGNSRIEDCYFEWQAA